MSSSCQVAILETEVLCKQPGRYIGWPTVCRRRNGELLAVFSGDRDEHVCPWGKVQMVRSQDDGANWSEPETICNSPLDDRDGGIIETRKGTLVVAWFTSLAFENGLKNVPMDELRREHPVRCQWMLHAEKLPKATRDKWLGSWTVRSEDGGTTWEEPVRTAGSAPHGPIELSDGRLLYVGRRHSNTGEKQALTVEESTDDACSWNVIANIETPEEAPLRHMHEPHVVETADGRLVAQIRFHFFDLEGNRPLDKCFLYQSTSEDGGRTWSVAEQTSLLGFPPHLIRLGNGWLLSVFGRRIPTYGEYGAISSDGGVSWGDAFLLSEGRTANLGYPASVQLADGSILTVYYQVDGKVGKPCLMGTRWRLEEG